MLDWLWRSLGYELDKDVVREWALNKMKAEKIEQELREKNLRTTKIPPAVPVKRSSKRLSIKQREQQKNYAQVDNESGTQVNKSYGDELEDIGVYKQQ